MLNLRVLRRAGLWAATACVLAACATSSGPKISGNWQEVGLSGSGNVRHAIDKDSIRRQGDVATFRDKKTVLDMALRVSPDLTV